MPRHYRGRLIGFVQREDTGAAMRALRQLDRLAERLGHPEPDDDLDQLLQAIRAGETDKADKIARRMDQSRQLSGPTQGRDAPEREA